MKRIIFVLCLVVFIGCNGGGGGDDGETDSYIGFATEDFSGKSLYYVSSSVYQLATFYPDGTAMASAMMTSGTPVLEQEVALWSIVNGELIIEASGDSVTYSLLSDNIYDKYFRANKYSINGEVSVVGMFYDQTTGLSQAQDFVNNNMEP